VFAQSEVQDETDRFGQSVSFSWSVGRSPSSEIGATEQAEATIALELSRLSGHTGHLSTLNVTGSLMLNVTTSDFGSSTCFPDTGIGASEFIQATGLPLLTHRFALTRPRLSLVFGKSEVGPAESSGPPASGGALSAPAAATARLLLSLPFTLTDVRINTNGHQAGGETETVGLGVWVFCVIGVGALLIIAIVAILIVRRLRATSKTAEVQNEQDDSVDAFIRATRSQEEMELAQADFSNPLAEDDVVASDVQSDPLDAVSTDEEML
jgi:hypothetical protein